MTEEIVAKTAKSLMCPSADSEMGNSVIFGIVTGSPAQPELVHLPQTKQIPPELLKLESPVKPTEIFRIAADCIEGDCQHFDGNQCRLIDRIIDNLLTVTDTLVPCPIRANCRWWHQQGKAACLRCPQVVRDNYHVSDRLLNAIDPTVYQD